MIPFTRMLKYGRVPKTVLDGVYTEVITTANSTFDISAVAVNNQAYFFGGIRSAALSTQAAYSFDTVVPTSLNSIAGVPTWLFGYAVGYFQGKIYLMGGRRRTSANGANIDNTSVYVYTIASNSWVTLTPTGGPTTGGYCAGCTLGNYIYMYGLNNTATLYRYDVNTNSFTTMAPATTTLTATGSMCTDGVRYLYITNNNTIERYDTQTNTWLVLKTATTVAGSCAYLNGYVYIHGANKFGRYNVNTDTLDIITTTNHYIRNTLVTDGMNLYCVMGYFSNSDISNKIYHIT